jgi:hypothetical protein
LSLVTGHFLSERLHRLGLGDFRPAVFAGAPGIVVPKIEHGLAEVIDDIGAIEIDVFDQGAAVLAVENDVLVFAGRPAAFNHDADGVRRADRGVRDIRRDEKSFALADEVIDDPVAFADPDFDVALELVKIFFGIDQVKIVPGVGPFDDHDEKVATIIEVAVADGRLEELAVRFDPILQVNRRLDFGRATGV